MATIQNAYAYWEPGPQERPIRGLFDVAEVYNVADPHVLLGAEYQTHRCNTGCEWGDYCLPPDVKEWMTLSNVQGDGFAVYDGLECDTLGAVDVAEYESRLRGTFDVKAEAAIETHLQQMIMASSAPLTAASLLEAIALLEAELAANYAGRGTLHMDRYTSLAAYSDKLIEDPESHDVRVQTINGTPIALGRGYIRQAGNYWVGAAGRVIVLRGPATFTHVPPLADKPSRFLLEQQVVVLAECLAVWSEPATTVTP